MIIVDLPPEEEGELRAYSNALDLVRLIAPTSLDARLDMLTQGASGFVYYVSVTGITGAASAQESELKESIARIRKKTSLPVAVGFGIKTQEQVKMVRKYADAVVVGSALVDEVAEAVDLNEDGTQRVLSKAESLAKAVRFARRGLTAV